MVQRTFGDDRQYHEDDPVLRGSLEPRAQEPRSACCKSKQTASGLTKFPVKSSMESQTAESHDGVM